MAKLMRPERFPQSPLPCLSCMSSRLPVFQYNVLSLSERVKDRQTERQTNPDMDSSICILLLDPAAVMIRWDAILRPSTFKKS